MGDISWDTIEKIIDKALALPAQQRQGYIDYECEGNEQLKKEVNHLLESITASEGWLENPDDYKEGLYKDLLEEASPEDAEGAWVGRRISGYTIREKLGMGGRERYTGPNAPTGLLNTRWPSRLSSTVLPLQPISGGLSGSAVSWRG